MAKAKMKAVRAVSPQEAEQAMALFAKNSTELKKIEATLEQEKQQIDNKYLKDISRLKLSIKDQTETLQLYGEKNKDGWEDKSLKMVHGKIGFRTGMPKVVKNNKYKWDGIVALIRASFPKFIRTTHEVDKEALIAARKSTLFVKIKNSCYVDVVQEETFFIEANEETLASA